MNILPNDLPENLSEFLKTTLIRLYGLYDHLRESGHTNIAVHILKACHQLKQALALLDKGGEK